MPARLLEMNKVGKPEKWFFPCIANRAIPYASTRPKIWGLHGGTCSPGRSSQERCLRSFHRRLSEDIPGTSPYRLLSRTEEVLEVPLQHPFHLPPRDHFMLPAQCLSGTPAS